MVKLDILITLGRLIESGIYRNSERLKAALQRRYAVLAFLLSSGLQLVHPVELAPSQVHHQ